LRLLTKEEPMRNLVSWSPKHLLPVYGLALLGLLVPKEAAAYDPGTLQHFNWSQYQGYATTMMNFQTGFCFLTAVSGRFEGAGEAVWIGLDGNYNWNINGHSGQNDLYAESVCITWAVAGGYAYGWMAYGDQWTSVYDGFNCGETGTCPYNEVTLWNNHADCWMMGMGGTFHGFDEQVLVSNFDPLIPNANGSRWDLFVMTGAAMTQGWAGCFDQPYNTDPLPIPNGEHVWNQGDPPVDLGADYDVVCGLTGVRGHFFGGGERVTIEDVNGRWVLSGSSFQEGVQGRARCFYPPIFVQN
jgi:hypothetical protein